MQIVTGTLSEDHSLSSEAVLMEQFGVSRPTLREAFRILESESLIDVRRGARGGARVKVPDGSVAARHVGYILQYRNTSMMDVYRARTMLESPLGSAVAKSSDEAAITRLEAAIALAEIDIDDMIAYGVHDAKFHLLVAELAGNETMRTMVDMLYDIVIPARKRYSEALIADQMSLDDREVHKTHAYFVSLIRRGDREAAEKLWLKHLNEIEHHYGQRHMESTVVEMMG
ncbi:MAG: putative GntR-family transcriptional regulator [Microbacteriaceae bacterium]|nr:putative GntR-family transcriptional regulator [Microbacteriaceae bacterium]